MASPTTRKRTSLDLIDPQEDEFNRTYDKSTGKWILPQNSGASLSRLVGGDLAQSISQGEYGLSKEDQDLISSYARDRYTRGAEDMFKQVERDAIGRGVFWGDGNTAGQFNVAKELNQGVSDIEAQIGIDAIRRAADEKAQTRQQAIGLGESMAGRAEQQRQFDTTQTGYLYPTSEDVFIGAPGSEVGTSGTLIEPIKTLSREATEEEKRRFDVQTEQRADEFAQSMGLSRDQFMESKRQFDLGYDLQNRELEASIERFNKELGERRREFDVTQTGVLDGEKTLAAQELELRIESLNQQADQWAAEFGLTKDQFLEDVRRYNEGAEFQDKEYEESIRRFDAQLSLDERNMLINEGKFEKEYGEDGFRERELSLDEQHQRNVEKQLEYQMMVDTFMGVFAGLEALGLGEGIREGLRDILGLDDEDLDDKASDFLTRDENGNKIPDWLEPAVGGAGALGVWKMMSKDEKKKFISSADGKAFDELMKQFPGADMDKVRGLKDDPDELLTYLNDLEEVDVNEVGPGEKSFTEEEIVTFLDEYDAKTAGADLNEDGIVNQEDFIYFAQNADEASRKKFDELYKPRLDAMRGGTGGNGQPGSGGGSGGGPGGTGGTGGTGGAPGGPVGDTGSVFFPGDNEKKKQENIDPRFLDEKNFPNEVIPWDQLPEEWFEKWYLVSGQYGINTKQVLDQYLSGKMSANEFLKFIQAAPNLDYDPNTGVISRRTSSGLKALWGGVKEGALKWLESGVNIGGDTGGPGVSAPEGDTDTETGVTIGGGPAGKLTTNYMISDSDTYQAKEGIGRQLKKYGYGEDAIADVMKYLDTDARSALEEALKNNNGRTTLAVRELLPQIVKMLQALPSYASSAAGDLIGRAG